MFQRSSGKGSPVAGNTAPVSNSCRRRRSDVAHSFAALWRRELDGDVLLHLAQLGRLILHALLGDEREPVVGPERNLAQLRRRQVQELFLAVAGKDPKRCPAKRGREGPEEARYETTARRRLAVSAAR